MGSSTYSVIVAEDEELLLNNIISKIHAANLGFEVAGKAQTGTQALELVKELSPDLLITDIRMPMMDGISLLENVHQRFPHINTIIVSGFSDFEYAKKAIRLQVSEYLLKPIDPNELYNALFNIKTKLELEQSSYSDIFNDSMIRNTPEQIASALKEYIVHNYDRDINLNLIANNMSYSSGYLTKLFYQQYQTSPSKYIISLRISKAKYFLAHNPELSIKQIGEMVGYPEQSYFSRIFKKQVGMSPFEYRETL